jgi:pimeloyl-ACP methyl ester carboxylesterase
VEAFVSQLDNNVVTVHKTKLYYTDSGPSNKTALVFLHAFPFSHAMWDEQAKLCTPHFRVITYDHRGQGRSEDKDTPFIFEFFIDDLITLLDDLHIEKAILCGLSMGGYVALRTVERSPERVLGLVLCDTRSESDSDTTKLKRAADLRLLQEQGLSVYAEKFMKGALASSTFTSQPAILERARGMILGNSPEGVQHMLLALATRTDTTAALGTIRVPTLLLVGEQDAITPVAASETMHKLIPHSALEVIPNAGHLSNLENPEIFNRHLLFFLKKWAA